jgi:DNA-binding NarL/FixJ family response regulator
MRAAPAEFGDTRYQLPVVSGLEAARQILLRIPGMLILLLTLDDSSQFVLAALACGARGLLVKGRATEDMVAAVSALLLGRKYFAGVRRAPPGGVSAAISGSNLDARPLF